MVEWLVTRGWRLHMGRVDVVVKDAKCYYGVVLRFISIKEQYIRLKFVAKTLFPA